MRKITSYYLRVSLASLIGTILYVLCMSVAFFFMADVAHFSNLLLLQGVLFLQLPPLLYAGTVYLLAKPLKFATRSLGILMLVYYFLNFFIVFAVVVLSVMVFAEPGEPVSASPQILSFVASMFFVILTLLLLALNPFAFSKKIAGEESLRHPNLS